MLTKEDLAIRSTRIGASELFDVIANPLGLWNRKMNPQINNAEWLRIGHLFERPTAEDYLFKYGGGRTLCTCSTIVNPSIPWLCGTPDFLLVRDGRTHCDRWEDLGEFDGLEIKTNAKIAEMWIAEDDKWGEDGSSQIPRRYVAQCMGYMAMTSRPFWTLHRLRFASQAEFYTYRIDRDLELEGLLLEAGARFVRDHLTTGKPPKEGSLDDRIECLSIVYPRAVEDIKTADEREDVILEAYKEAVQEEKRAALRREYIELFLTSAIAGAVGVQGTAGAVKWGNREGKRTVNAQKAVDVLCGLLSEDVPAEKLANLARQAIEAATTQGAPYRQISKPKDWTAGIEAEVRAEFISPRFLK